VFFFFIDLIEALIVFFPEILHDCFIDGSLGLREEGIKEHKSIQGIS
jgi:hypothetical protein